MKRTLGKTLLLAGLSLAGGLSLTGCASGGYGNYGYYSSTPPPPYRYESRGYAPGAGYAWVDGYWGYRGGNYAWVPGNWVRPPRGRSTWSPGRWENRRSGYVYRQGRWR